MAPRKHALPLAAMENLLKNAGADRVGEDAKAALRDVLEEEAERIGKQAIAFAAHASRKTIRAEDIKLAKR